MFRMYSDPLPSQPHCSSLLHGPSSWLTWSVYWFPVLSLCSLALVFIGASPPSPPPLREDLSPSRILHGPQFRESPFLLILSAPNIFKALWSCLVFIILHISWIISLMRMIPATFRTVVAHNFLPPAQHSTTYSPRLREIVVKKLARGK